jgi:hypothetical protein
MVTVDASAEPAITVPASSVAAAVRSLFTFASWIEVDTNSGLNA